jgi:hypothetical protein
MLWENRGVCLNHWRIENLCKTLKTAEKQWLLPISEGKKWICLTKILKNREFREPIVRDIWRQEGYCKINTSNQTLSLDIPAHGVAYYKFISSK